MAEVQATEIRMTKLVLGLSEQEVQIMKGWVQNSLVSAMAEESEVEAKLRKTIFEALGGNKPLTR